VRTITRSYSWSLAGAAVLALAAAPPAGAARYGVPTNLDAAGQLTAGSADPPGWFVLERLDSGSANGDVVHQIRLFVEVTGTTLDVRVFDAGLSDARDLGRAVTTRYRLLNPDATTRGALTITTDSATTENRLARFACQDAGGTTAVFNAPNAAASATNRIWGAGTGGNCTALAHGLYIFEITIQSSTGDPTYEGRNAFGVEFLDSAGDPYNAYTIGNADDTIATVAATDTSMITGAVAGDRPTANVSGYTAFFPYVNRGCTIDASNFDLDADNAEGNGSVATLVDTLGSASDLTRSDNDNVATTTATVEPTGVTNLDAINYGMFTLKTQLDEWATAQNHVDWRIADFQGSTAGSPTKLPPHPFSPIRMYLPGDYSACATSGCTLTAPGEPVLTASAVLVSGENPPLPGGSITRFTLTAKVTNLGSSAITAVQITVPLVAGVTTYVAGTLAGTIDGASGGSCTDTSGSGYQSCTFASLPAGSYASIGFDVDFQPPATGVQNLTGAPAAGSPPPNTTVWAQYTPASQSATYPRTESLGPICQLAVNAAPPSDLSVSSPTDSPDPVTAGTNLTYTFQLQNLGTAAAPNASVTDLLPTGTTFVSASAAPATGWSCVTPPVGSSGMVRCSIASFSTGTTVTFTVVVRVSSTVANGTVLENVAGATSGNTDPNTSNNTVSMTTTVTSPAASADLAVTVVDTPDPVPSGKDITYTIVVTNNGPATAIAVTLTDTVPAHTTFRSVSTASGWGTCTAPAVGGTGTVSCPLASLASGQQSVVTLRVTVTGGSTITNTASVSSAVADPVSTNNSATATTTVAAAGTCPTPGDDGNGHTLGGVDNSYYAGTATAAAGSSTISLGGRHGAGTSIAAGDLLLVIQMQDAAINYTNTDAYGDGTAGDGEARGATAQNSTGRYEYAVAASAVVGGTLTVSHGLLNTYTNANATGTQGQRRFQVVRVPQYTTATLGSTLTASPWNGTWGGVLAFDVPGALALGGATVSVSGLGFRGGGAQQRTG
jgi:uncharacterized repeat protein (TIGR01451 family)